MSKDFKKIARKIKRRRTIVSAIIVLVTLVVTASVLNYKASQGNEEPIIALGTNYEFGDETTIKITTSLGFKYIKYESRYGKNYSECVPFWKTYDKDPVSIAIQRQSNIIYVVVCYSKELLLQVPPQEQTKADECGIAGTRACIYCLFV